MSTEGFEIADGADQAGPTAAGDGLDHELLLAEIYAEVERRRSSGELPGELERDLDRAFAELAPAGAVGDGSALALERVQRTSFIQPRVPLEDLRPPVSQVKRVLFKLMAWYVHFVTDQVSAFGGAVTQALRNHDQRLTSLEEGGPPVPERVAAELDRLPDPPAPAALVDAVAAAVVGVPGRVLVAEAGDGALLRALLQAGVPAYGAEPRRSRLPQALREGLEIRPTTGLEHLRLLADGRLGAVVLAGSAVERATTVAQSELAAEAARAVAPGGKVLVLSRTPEAWLLDDAGPAADLAPGRPLRPATWAHLLTSAGCTVSATTSAPSPEVVPPVDAEVPGAEQLNALIDRLAPLVAPAPAYLVTAQRQT